MKAAHVCPVCRSKAWPTDSGLHIVRHRDKAGQVCPASGYPIYIAITNIEEVAS